MLNTDIAKEEGGQVWVKYTQVDKGSEYAGELWNE